MAENQNSELKDTKTLLMRAAKWVIILCGLTMKSDTFQIVLIHFFDR